MTRNAPRRTAADHRRREERDAHGGQAGRGVHDGHGGHAGHGRHDEPDSQGNREGESEGFGAGGRRYDYDALAALGGGKGLQCRVCGCRDVRTLKTERIPGGIRRRKSCRHCGFRFSTVEVGS